MKATGWAVVYNGKIDIKTVYAARRGAIINWLVTERAVPILSGHTDEQIESVWDVYRGAAEAVQVTVTATHVTTITPAS